MGSVAVERLWVDLVRNQRQGRVMGSVALERVWVRWNMEAFLSGHRGVFLSLWGRSFVPEGVE